jgi:hypothetical protein
LLEIIFLFTVPDLPFGLLFPADDFELELPELEPYFLLDPDPEF